MSTISDGTTTITPDLVLGYETNQAGMSIFHDVLGRPDPDVSLRPLGTRSGTLELFFLTEAQAQAARALHAGAVVLTYTATDNPSTSMSYVVDDRGVSVQLDPSTRRRWLVSVAYREVIV